ncbi:unnamed protein product [Prunus armeniaca]
MDNLRPKLLISKQAIVNLGEEYLPSKFISCLSTKLVVLARINDKKVNYFQAELPFTKLKRERPTLKKGKKSVRLQFMCGQMLLIWAGPALEGFLNGQNWNLFSLEGAEVAGFDDY